MNFDLSKVELSHNDIRRKLTLPLAPTAELAQIVGIIIGDGYPHGNNGRNIIGIVGNERIDAQYFGEIQMLIKTVFNIKTTMRTSSRALRIVFKSKGVFSFFKNVLQIQNGHGKGQSVVIPPIFLADSNLSSAVIRGLFDSDGTIFTSKKPGCPTYPTIELTTTSHRLAEQVRIILITKGFRVPNVRSYNYKHSWNTSYKVSLYGKKNAFLWNTHIGFSNPLKQIRLQEIIGSGNAGI